MIDTHPLTNLLAERLASGLKRKAVTTCSKWSEKYRIMGRPFAGKWTFKYHPWLRAMHDCDAPTIVGQKGAQLGFTECALNKVFFSIDINGVSVLYILPASTDASDFSTSRFDPALEASSHLRSLFSDVKNVRHKRAGTANLFVRGSRSRSQLKSVPAGLVIFDEVDEMIQENIALAFERMSGQINKQKFLISTPTIENYGINAFWKNSTQEEFFFKCPHCGRLTRFIFPDCLIITADDFTNINIQKSHLICKECKHILSHEGKYEYLSSGVWVPAKENMLAKGYHISQMYSPTIKPWELAEAYLKSLTNPTDEQEFHNSKMGTTHTVKGARVEDSHIDSCIGTYVMKDHLQSGFKTIGIDVGKVLHYEIDSWRIPEHKPTKDINLLCKPVVIKIGTVNDFEELDRLMLHFRINFGVIDAQPERRKSVEFANRFNGRIKACFYGPGVNGKTIKVHDETEQTITVDRTSWLDLSLGRFIGRTIRVPKDIPLDYRAHLKTLIRVYKKDNQGNPVGMYVKADNDPDHYAHARNYAEIALILGLSLGKNLVIGSAP